MDSFRTRKNEHVQWRTKEVKLFKTLNNVIIDVKRQRVNYQEVKKHVLDAKQVSLAVHNETKLNTRKKILEELAKNRELHMTEDRNKIKDMIINLDNNVRFDDCVNFM